MPSALRPKLGKAVDKAKEQLTNSFSRLALPEERAVSVKFVYKGRAKGVSLIYQLHCVAANGARVPHEALPHGIDECQQTGTDTFETQIRFNCKAEDMYELEYYFLGDGNYRATNSAAGPAADSAGRHTYMFMPGEAEELNELTLYHSGYSFSTRITSQHSQYNIPLPPGVPQMGAAGASACTSIACAFIHRALSHREMTQAADLDEVLVQGITAHARRHAQAASNSGEVEHMGVQEVLLLDPELCKLLVPEGMVQAQASIDKYGQVLELLRSAALKSADDLAAATLTTQFVTVALLCQVKPRFGKPANWVFHMFDSHSFDYGDGRPSGATLLSFSSADQLQQFLQERFAMDAKEFMLDVYEATQVALKASGPGEVATGGMSEQLQTPAQHDVQPLHHQVEPAGSQTAAAGSYKQAVVSSVPEGQHCSASGSSDRDSCAARETEDVVMEDCTAAVLDHSDSAPASSSSTGRAVAQGLQLGATAVGHSPGYGSSVIEPTADAAACKAAPAAGGSSAHLPSWYNVKNNVQQPPPASHDFIAADRQLAVQQPYTFPSSKQSHVPPDGRDVDDNLARYQAAAAASLGSKEREPGGHRMPGQQQQAVTSVAADCGPVGARTYHEAAEPAVSAAQIPLPKHQIKAIDHHSVQQRLLARAPGADSASTAPAMPAQYATDVAEPALNEPNQLATSGLLNQACKDQQEGLQSEQQQKVLRSSSSKEAAAAGATGVTGPAQAPTEAAAVPVPDKLVPTPRSVADALYCYITLQKDPVAPASNTDGSLLRYFCKRCYTVSRQYTDIVGVEDIIDTINLDPAGFSPAFLCNREELACCVEGSEYPDPGQLQLLCCRCSAKVGLLQEQHSQATLAQGAYVFPVTCQLLACREPQ